MYFLIYFIALPFFKPTEDNKECEELIDLEENLKKIKQKLLLTTLVLDRYKELIEEKEEKSVSVLKYLINPENRLIRTKAEEIKKEREEYSVDGAIQKSVEYIKTIKTIRWPVSFWLSFEEMDKHKIGDDMDKCLFLCSLFKSLNIESKIMVDKDRQPFILCTANQLNYLIDCDKGIVFQGKEEEILNSKTFIYSFNDKEYDDLSKNEIDF
ncbi:hypothetical protein KO317_00795 [Candidatus Micrarchaeota archaeon]|jgi:hypothetical protein|nr:hypothetical protein [Candidatus Micrarchaeota archaeon]